MQVREKTTEEKEAEEAAAEAEDEAQANLEFSLLCLYLCILYLLQVFARTMCFRIGIRNIIYMGNGDVFAVL